MDDSLASVLLDCLSLAHSETDTATDVVERAQRYFDFILDNIGEDEE